MLGLYLIHGRSILLGSFLSSLITIYQQSQTSPIPTYLVAVLAVISILQLVISKRLISHFFTFPIKIDVNSEIIKFLMISGPLAAFITSSMVVLSLWLLLDISAEVLCYIWAVKWFGDFIGIIFLTPIILFLNENAFVKKTKHQQPKIFTSLCVLSVIGIIYILLSRSQYMQKEQQFIKATQPFVQHINVIQSSIKHHLIA